ncbi:amidohydrolase [Sediminicoccus rosea]|jgi:predicted amidohydrolase YtcJ|uniref:Amidohydrolase n=1 Tax=Sediminicoccus rosea TaxID=1225128 RepID=A0ABZ0PJG4_9PROT|nr:amidohydrolase [Sediminicoccus rosea]WPB85794.1 amidohydrolase [Sediminicoccus rosea]
MCRACVSPLIAHPSLFSQPGGLAGLFKPPTRRGFMAVAVSAAAAPLAGQAQTVPWANTPANAPAPTGPETIFRGGNIVTMAGDTMAEAIAVTGGRITAVGAAADVMALATRDTRIVNLQGRTLLPGLIDPHNHTALSSLYLELLTDIGYLKNRTRADLLANLRQLVANTPEGQWVMVSNFDNLLQGGDLSRTELDGISTTRPIFVWYTNGHDAAVNSAALRAANIPEDIGALPGGGHFGRGPDGRLDGRVFEMSAMLKVVSVGLPRITPQLATQAINRYMQAAAATGNTLLHEPGTMKSEWIEGFSQIAATAPLRLSASLMYEDMAGFAPYRSLGLGPRAAQLPNSLLMLYGVKIVGDGSNQTRTGGQTQPYLGGTDMGQPNFNADQMKQMVAAVKAAGMPVLIHCNGDKTIDFSLDAIEAAYGNSTAFGINRIEHATMLRQDQIVRMKRLNIEPSFLMNHVTLYGAAYRDQIFGPTRAAFTDPAGACAKEGVRFTLHTDSPCSPLGTLRLVQTAVTRICQVDNSVIGADQAVTVRRALESVTVDAARQLGLADRLGTVERGKEADFTILEENPLTVDPTKIAAIKVSETWVAGQKKFG